MKAFHGILTFSTDSIVHANPEHAQSHDPRRDIPQDGNPRGSTDEPWDAQTLLLLRSECRSDHPFLELRLKGLNDSHRPLTLALNSTKLAGGNAAVEQRLGEQVRSDYGVLNGVVDS